MSPSNQHPKVISLFAGCGGSSMGYHLAGCKVLAAVEFDRHAAETYKANFPNTRIYNQDIGQLNPTEILKELSLKPGELDILDGSPPCQGFSTAGKRKVQDSRNRLFEEYVRFLNALQPKAFVMENVTGLVSGKMKVVFKEIIEALKNEGYTVSARILNASHYGVPQNRRRVIILGFRNDLNLKPVHPMPLSRPTSIKEALAELRETGPTVTPEGHALKLLKVLKPGESGAALHRRYRQKGNDFSIVRVHWNRPAPTIVKTIRKSQCGIFHPDDNRFLTINEIKHLSSFLDDFILTGPFEEQWARIGNAVPRLLTKAIAEQLIHQLEG